MPCYRMNRNHLLIAATALLPFTASADAVGLRIGAYAWQQEFEGTVQDGPTEIDINSTLGLDDETNNVFYVALEHPIPVLPNIALSHTEMEVSARNRLNENFVFDDQVFIVTDTVTTNADLSHTDLTLYYEVLDNWVSLDLGLTVRAFDSSIDIKSSSGDAELDIDGALPMLYAAVKFDLPLTGLYVGASGSGISYEDSSITDYMLNIGYETTFGLGVEAGLRSFDINYEDEDDDTEQADLTVDGSYVSLFYHF